ncbi:MAG: aminoglycoside phosphotransferase, partial [Actinomycetota bacterium]
MAALLPPRAQSRVESLDGRVAILDALDLGATADGDRACVAVVRVLGSAEHRDVVVPGRLHEGAFVRDAGVARYLRSQESAAFTVEIIGSGIPAGHAREIDVDQSNDSVIVGDDASAVMVKWQLDAAPSPAPSRLRSLIGTDLTPPLRGVVQWRDDAGVERTLMTAADYLPGADDGWTWAVELVRSHARGERVDAIEPFAVLGEMTARM